MGKIKFTGNDGKTYEIDESLEIARGGEARLISLTNGKIAKVYFDKKQKISDNKIKTLSRLSSTFLKPEVSIKSNTENGFIMEELNSTYYPLYSMFSLPFVRKHVKSSSYKKDIGLKLIEAVKEAHEKDIVIGDINPFNIMLNDMMDVKFIDVDSYQTLGEPHNGKLLEEIADYYYNCLVSKDSDYFGLSVLLFNLFTHMHPYKGNHIKFGNKLRDRMVNNLSIISNHKNDITVPKFYEPINDKFLLNQFEEIFNLNKRFLLSLDKSVITSIKDNGNIISNDLLITTFVFNTEIKNIDISENYICVKFTNNNYTVYRIVSKGRIDKLCDINDFDDVFVSDKNIIALKNGELFLWKNYNFEKITSLTLFNSQNYRQYGNILLSLSSDNFMYKIMLDETFSNSIKYEKKSVFTKSFTNYNGLINRFGENKIIYYSNGKDLCSVIYPDKIEDLTQSNTVGVANKKVNNKIVFELFSINKTYGKINKVQIDENYSVTDADNFIIMYKNDKLMFLNKENFTEVASFSLENMDGFEIKNSKAGIIAFDNKTAKIINRK